jgi:hypothetical protein
MRSRIAFFDPRELFLPAQKSSGTLQAGGQENQQKETKVTKFFCLGTQIGSSFSLLARESVRSCLL